MVDRLAEAIGPDNLVSGEQALRYASDATGALGPGVVEGGRTGTTGAERQGAMVEAVALPRDACETQKIVAIAQDLGVPMVARGGGTGLRGGAVPMAGGIVISTERMKGACEIHKEDLYAVAGAGVTVRDLRRQVEAAGLYFPIDPASESTATVGGSVGDGAVGMHGLKYGTMRNYVLGLEVVTPDAKTLALGARTVKNVAGYDLTRFMVGAEGVFAIVTSAILKLLPMGERRVLAFDFADGAGAGSAAAEIMKAGFDPAALEIADATTMTAVREFLGRAAPGAVREHSAELAREVLGATAEPAHPAILLVEFHGTGSLCAGEASKIKGMLQKKFGARVRLEVDYPDAEALWDLRKAALAALGSRSSTVVVVDLLVPREKIPKVLDDLPVIASRHRTEIAIFGHAGEGVLHAAFLTDARDRDAWLRTRAAMSAVAGACAGLGGSVSAERGIGLGSLPGPWPGISGVGLDVLGRIKRAVDPKGIMNPGKLGREG